MTTEMRIFVAEGIRYGGRHMGKMLVSYPDGTLAVKRYDSDGGLIGVRKFGSEREKALKYWNSNKM